MVKHFRNTLSYHMLNLRSGHERNNAVACVYIRRAFKGDAGNETRARSEREPTFSSPSTACHAGY